MRGLLVVVMLVAGLSGCAESSGELPADSHDETHDQLEPDVNGTIQNSTQDLLQITNFTANATSVMAPGNVTFAIDGEGITAWDLLFGNVSIANGTEVPASPTYLFTVAGNHTVNLTVTDGNQTLVESIFINVTGGGVVDTVPDGGRVSSTTTGASAQAIIGRTPFDMTALHAQLEIVVNLDDPAATIGGEDYVVRTTPPSGGNKDYTVKNGDVIVIPEPEMGAWEIGVFPPYAGSWSWTADYCGYTLTTC